MTAQPVSKSLAIVSLGLFCLLAAACESNPAAPDSTTTNPVKLGSNETALPSGCLYGDPVVRVMGRTLRVSCPDGGDGIDVECDGAPVEPRFLDDGRVVAACSDGKAPQISSPKPPVREEP